jgi:hypothetical protein
VQALVKERRELVGVAVVRQGPTMAWKGEEQGRVQEQMERAQEERGHQLGQEQALRERCWEQTGKARGRVRQSCWGQMKMAQGETQQSCSEQTEDMVRELHWKEDCWMPEELGLGRCLQEG